MHEGYIVSEKRPTAEVAAQLTAEGFNQPVSPALQAEVSGILDRSSLLLTLEEEVSGREVGYGAFKEYACSGQPVLFISSIMIAASLQGKKLNQQLIKEALGLSQANYVAFNTQSARMYAAARKMFGNIYPSFDGLPYPADIAAVADCVTSLRGTTYPVQRNLYNRPLYSSSPDHPAFPEFYRLVNLEAGDALFCVSRVDDIT